MKVHRPRHLDPRNPAAQTTTWPGSMDSPNVCGHVGCCDSSPNRHATGHFRATVHPLIQAFEPGEDWYWCYLDDVAFELPGQGPSPSHTVQSAP